MNTLNPSVKHHVRIGVLASIWILIFALFVRPFEHGNMDEEIWAYVSIGFSLSVFLCYGFISIIQQYIYQKLAKWNTELEAGILFLFFLFYLLATYVVYKSTLVKGPYQFFDFFSKIILNIAVILTPLLMLARRYSLTFLPDHKALQHELITIKGENKLDILKINKQDLVCVSNAQNYVEVFFLEKGKLKTKILRSSLKKIQEELNFLMQVHRSHLINPAHFQAWKNRNTISLTQIELPISSTYREQILAL